MVTSKGPTSAVPSSTGNISSGLGHYSLTASTEERQLLSDELTDAQRTELRRSHPWLQARLFQHHQKLIFDYIINGSDLPLGGRVVDAIRRLEFQERENKEHGHAMYAIELAACIDLDFDINDPAALKRFVERLESIVTGVLKERRGVIDKDVVTANAIASNNTEQLAVLAHENDPDYRPTRDYWSVMGERHPGYTRFNPSLNYDYVHSPEATVDSDAVHTLCRKHQLAYQIHHCCIPCYKYVKFGGEKKCRYHYPRPVGETTTVVKERGPASRSRTAAYLRTGNMYSNAVTASPLLHSAIHSNVDVQFLINKAGGAAEYLTKYVTKAEAPDSLLFKNLLIKMLANYSLSEGNKQQLNSTIQHLTFN
jgi:hypothetical protein